MPDEDLEFPSPSPDELGPRAVVSPALLETVARAYGLDMGSPIVDLGGTYNLNLHLESAAGPVVVRVHRPWVTAERLLAVQAVKARIAGQGLPVALPLCTRSGATFVAAEGRLVEVEPYIEHDGTADTWERVQVAFGTLGRLHGALSAIPDRPAVPPRVSNYGTPRQLAEWAATTEHALRGRQGEESGDEAQSALPWCRKARVLIQRLGEWWETSGRYLPRQTTHGDYGGANLLFRQGQVAAILDFDFTARRERLFDLAYAIYWALVRLDARSDPADHAWDRIASLLAAYQQAAHPRPLTPAEVRALPMEIARVPLYWVAEAGFTENPARGVLAVTDGIALAQWLMDHQAEVAAALAVAL